jgi:hypothetical protein
MENPLGAIVGIAFAVFLAAADARSQQPPIDNRDRPTPTETQGRNAGQAVANPVAEKHQPERKQEGEWYGTLLDRAPDWFVAVFTGLLAFITFRLAAMTGGLKKSTDKLWRVTDDTLRHAEATTERQLRAYIFPRRPRIKGLFGPDGITVICHFENFGQTPAYGVQCVCDVTFERDREGGHIAIASMESLSQVDLGPRGSFRISKQHRPLTDAEQQELRQGTKGVYFRGSVTYKDTFGQPQTTKFKMMKHLSGGLDDNRLAVCLTGNKAT